MNYSSNDLEIEENSFYISDNEWVKESEEVFGSDTYSVYHGTGDSSLVKILINDEIVEEIK